MKSMLAELAQWLRRGLRCLRLKQCRKTFALARFLMGLGVREDSAWMLASSGKGWWRLALNYHFCPPAAFVEAKPSCGLGKFFSLQGCLQGAQTFP